MIQKHSWRSKRDPQWISEESNSGFIPFKVCRNRSCRAFSVVQQTTIMFTIQTIVRCIILSKTGAPARALADASHTTKAGYQDRWYSSYYVASMKVMARQSPFLLSSYRARVTTSQQCCDSLQSSTNAKKLPVNHLHKSWIQVIWLMC